jgi:hypothetical protein
MGSEERAGKKRKKKVREKKKRKGVGGVGYSLLHDLLNPVAALLQYVHLGPVGQAHEMVARAVKQVSAARGVQVEEDARHDNDLLLQASLEEVETIGNGPRESLKVEPSTTMQGQYDYPHLQV